MSWVSHLTPIPDGVPLEVAAPVLCAGVTVYAALRTANVKPGDYVLIAGAGGRLTLHRRLSKLEATVLMLSRPSSQAALATSPCNTPGR